MDTAVHMDTATIAMLQDVMEDGFENLIHTYLQDSQMRIANLHEAAASNDAEAIRQTAHSLKGSSGNVGATRMAALSLTMEDKGKNKELTGIDDLIAEIESEFKLVNDYMTSLIQ